MALSKLNNDERGIIFSKLCNVLEPRVVVGLSSASIEQGGETAREVAAFWLAEK